MTEQEKDEVRKTMGYRMVHLKYKGSHEVNIAQDEIRIAAAVLINAITKNGKDHRRNTLAKDCVENAVMWAIKSANA